MRSSRLLLVFCLGAALSATAQTTATTTTTTTTAQPSTSTTQDTSAQPSASATQDNTSDQQRVEPMDKTPIYRVNVVQRTTRAVNYRHRGGSTTVDFRGTDLMPSISGHAKVDGKAGRLVIDAELEHMQPAPRVGSQYLTYVLWAVTPEGRAMNEYIRYIESIERLHDQDDDSRARDLPPVRPSRHRR